MREIGDRIGAILGSDGKVVKFLGFGVYEGDEVPPPEAGGFNMGFPNPKLKLDSGKIAWGCECWWGSEDSIKAELDRWRSNGLEIIEVDIDAARNEA